MTEIKFCRQCGALVRANERFCRMCGRPIVGASSQQEPVQTYNRPMQTVPQYQQRPEMAINMPNVGNQTMNASAFVGELDFGELSLPGSVGVSAVSESISSPVMGVLGGISSLLSGMLGILKKPSALIGTIILAVFWFVLGQLRDNDSDIVLLLSWLTFSEGGYDRSVPGMIGGVLGKGTVAAAFLSLFGSGLKNAFKGIMALFTGHGEKRSIIDVLLGIIAGIVIYFAFVGPSHVSEITSMAGVAGALLSLEALGGENGKLYALVNSITSKKSGEVRTAVKGKCDGFLTGLTLGFTLGAMLPMMI